MIDHLLRFADEATAKADPVVGTYFVSDGQGGGVWRGDVCISAASVYQVTDTDPQPYPGWFIVISLPNVSADLQGVAANGCRLITDRRAANLGQDFVLYTAPDIETDFLSVGRIEPLFAGSNYPFGQGS